VDEAESQRDFLFRSLWPAARLKQVMDATGVDVETVTQPVDRSTLGLWAWVAEREIENIRERTLMGREAMARAGNLVTGNPAYGFKYDPDLRQLRHADGEKPHVITMFDWVDQSKSVNSLVTHLIIVIQSLALKRKTL
jgi:DNA invertase Pin-like site-specific DNA recombinase